LLRELSSTWRAGRGLRCQIECLELPQAERTLCSFGCLKPRFDLFSFCTGTHQNPIRCPIWCRGIAPDT